MRLKNILIVPWKLLLNGLKERKNKFRKIKKSELFHGRLIGKQSMSI